jgi:3-methyladenine DNA glycosylase AlkC
MTINLNGYSSEIRKEVFQRYMRWVMINTKNKNSKDLMNRKLVLEKIEEIKKDTISKSIPF